ncbi:protein trichome birefringence-like 19 [Coffea arabica]|uniref:Protein trichome birefringence-like 19 n=2 Tax=Coffea TaxID=13442 RepID=A0A6P6TF09_COFAR|nr:protein trichome birefringence-like 19 [Coffea arabica]
MKACIITLPSGKRTCPDVSSKRLSLLILSFLLLSTAFFCLYNYSFSPWRLDMELVYRRSSLPSSRAFGLVNRCDMFSGDWVPQVEGPYYTNETKCQIDDRQNCIKFGRPDTEFMKWRWKPSQCEVPPFNATLFLELVRGKSLAFIGDSLARNQMQSLVCLLASAADPVDNSYTADPRFRQWFYAEYNFTLAIFWSVHLVKSEDADTNIYPVTSQTLYLDEVDEIWANHIEKFNYVIISAGQWFLRPLVYYRKGKLIGCYACNKRKITGLSMYYGYQMAFRTSFTTLLNLEKFKGTTFLRTISPQHYENGGWNTGGTCVRTRPIAKDEIRFEEYFLKLYSTQVAELIAADGKGKKRGLKFRILDPTDMMAERADGHPNHYGHGPGANFTNADCVHWCLPGPIDTWNEILLQVLQSEYNATSLMGKSTPTNQTNS